MKCCEHGPRLQT